MAKSFDSFIKELVTEEIENAPCPSSDGVWEQVIMKYKKERRKILYRKLKPVYTGELLNIQDRYIRRKFKT